MPKKHTQLALLPTKAVECYRRQQDYADSFPVMGKAIDYVPASETAPVNPSQIIQNQHNHYYGGEQSNVIPITKLAPPQSTEKENSVLLTLLFSTGVSLFLLGFLLAVAIGR